MRSNEEIKRGLECCFNGRSCNDCSYSDDPTPALCDDHLGRDALELIKQQERKIEELTAENEKRKRSIFIDFEIDEKKLEITARRLYYSLHEAAERAIKDATEGALKNEN